MNSPQLPNAWRWAKLSDLGEVNRGRSRHRPRYAEHLYGGRYPFIQTGDVKESGGLITSYRQTYSEAGLAQSRLWPAGTMCITIAANIAETGVLTFPACFPDSVVGFIPDPDLADVRFVEYSFRYIKESIQRQASGSVQDNINLGTLERLRIPVPPIEEQRAIAHILGTLDDKIELNRQMNQTLDELARTIFRSWFVDFDPVRAKADGREPDGMDAETAALFPDRFVDSALGPIPEGWRMESLEAFADVTYGAAFASSRFNVTGLGRPLLRIRDLPSQNPGVWTDEVHPRGSLVGPGDIVVGMDGEFRAYLWAGPVSWLNQRVCRLNPKEGDLWAYILYAIPEPLNFYERSKTGTTVIHLGKADIDSIKLLAASETIHRRFSELANPLLSLQVTNAQESRALAELRDTLLPELLSGRMSISDTVEMASREDS